MSTPWGCSNCGEQNDASFDVCWNCGSSKQGQSDPEFQAAVEPIQDRDRCKVCGYSLRGLTEPICPECGTPFDADRVDTAIAPPPPRSYYKQQRKRWNVRCFASWISLIIVCAVFWMRGDQETIADSMLNIALAVSILSTIASTIFWFCWFFAGPLEAD